MKETDFHFDTETLESGRRFFTRPCNFMLSVANLDQLPPSDKDEIAFVGRSNVGKSSLINALFNKSGLAKTSSTPGRTQQLNFFNLDDKLYIVDLPGYGFAKAPPEDVKKWQNGRFSLFTVDIKNSIIYRAVLWERRKKYGESRTFALSQR